MVPELLRAWVGALHRTRRRAPDSLRYVAVGGAPVPASLADAGWAYGIPVHEGYGLSECASVVALNRAGARRSGTVGTPLDGVKVAIEDGEIVVHGPTVMDGYLGGAPVGCVWHTGDLGHIEDDGRIVIDGRRDNLLVTAGGRNVQAEWVERALAREPAIAFAAVIGHGAPVLTAVIVPSPESRDSFVDPHRALAAVRAACADLPAYAVPGRVVVTDLASLAAANLLTPTGRPCRPALAAHFLSSSDAQGANKEHVIA
jgi:long-subunit acyl-CoA synthetase (AMP-forming)